jgi:hypothetical protein
MLQILAPRVYKLRYNKEAVEFAVEAMTIGGKPNLELFKTLSVSKRTE